VTKIPTEKSPLASLKIAIHSSMSLFETMGFFLELYGTTTVTTCQTHSKVFVYIKGYQKDLKKHITPQCTSDIKKHCFCCFREKIGFYHVAKVLKITEID